MQSKSDMVLELTSCWYRLGPWVLGPWVLGRWVLEWGGGASGTFSTRQDPSDLLSNGLELCVLSSKNVELSLEL